MNIIRKIKRIYYTVLVGLVLAPQFVFADSMPVNLKDANPIKSTDIYGLISAVLDFVVKIGAAIVVFFMVYAGFLFVTAQGSDDKISKAKATFFWTVIGALVLLGASTLSQIVCNTANDLGANVSCNRN